MPLKALNTLENTSQQLEGLSCASGSPQQQITWAMRRIKSSMFQTTKTSKRIPSLKYLARLSEILRS
jgi:hypothetical protein